MPRLRFTIALLATLLVTSVVLTACETTEFTPDLDAGPDASADLADFLGPYSEGVSIRRPPPYRMAQ